MKIQICVPCYKGIIHPDLKIVISKLLGGITSEHQFSYSSFTDVTPDASRNEAIFPSPLQYPELPDVDAFLLLDADMLPTIGEINRLIDYYIQGDYLVLGAVYKKNNVDGKPSYCVQIQPGQSETELFPGIIPVHTMGFGCAIVSKKVFDIIPKPWFHDSWETYADTKTFRRVPGDENFCRKIRESGARVFCHFGIEIEHDIVPLEELNKRMSLTKEKDD